MTRKPKYLLDDVRLVGEVGSTRYEVHRFVDTDTNEKYASIVSIEWPSDERETIGLLDQEMTRRLIYELTMLFK